MKVWSAIAFGHSFNTFSVKKRHPRLRACGPPEPVMSSMIQERTPGCSATWATLQSRPNWPFHFYCIPFVSFARHNSQDQFLPLHYIERGGGEVWIFTLIRTSFVSVLSHPRSCLRGFIDVFC
jgi:hypothetical protein